MIQLEAKQVVKTYRGPGGDVEVLQSLDFTLRPASLVAIVGASGAGKSTLLHVLGTLERPTSGSIQYQGKEVFSLNSNELARFRNRQLGFVFQFHHLLPELNALENVMLPGLIAGRPRYDLRKAGERLLEAVGLQARVEHRPSELSGGEQQRVAVARALINDPLLLLADEPSGNLDGPTGEDLHDLLEKLVREQGQTIVVATHNQRLADRADAVYRMEGGKLHDLRGFADNRN
jgi:lipoprotein-releasing system ATP-binding protein